MQANFLTADDLHKRGFDALVAALGPVEAIRFVQLFGHGSGDYTQDRHAMLGKPTVGELVQRMRDSGRTGG